MYIEKNQTAARVQEPLSEDFTIPYLHQFSAEVQKMFLFMQLEKICIILGDNLTYLLKELVPELHFLMVLIGTNVVSNISTKA